MVLQAALTSRQFEISVQRTDLVFLLLLTISHLRQNFASRLMALTMKFGNDLPFTTHFGGNFD